MHVRADAVAFATDRILASPGAAAFFADLRSRLAAPVVGSAVWRLLAHRPLPDQEDRFLPTYTVRLAVDRLGIVPDAYLAHDADTTPEFDLRTLFAAVGQRAPAVRWRAQVEVSFLVQAGMLFDVSLRLPEGLPGVWAASIDEPPQQTPPIESLAALRSLARTPRRVVVSGVFEDPTQIGDDDVRGRVGVITGALVDTPCEIETGWPVTMSLTRYEWEE